jgi:predicted metal-dependent RNase
MGVFVYNTYMTITLKDQIDTAQKKQWEIEQRLKEQKELIQYLENLRWDCDHDFAPALKGYEHEGGHCKKCGINEVYWDCNKNYHTTKVTQ